MLRTATASLARSRALRTTTIAGLVGATFVVAPAATATDWTVTTADEYIAALAAASVDDSGPHTITIGDNFRIRLSDGTPAYWGTQPLTIDGNGYTVRGEGTPSEGFDLTNVFLGMTPMSASAPAPGEELTAEEPEWTAGAITIENVRLRNFVDVGAIVVMSTYITVRDSVLFDNAAPSSDFLPLGSAITTASGLTLDNVTIRDNVGGVGAVSDFLTGSGPLEPAANTVTDSTFLRNTGLVGGALLSLNEATVTGSTFRENEVLGAGGALALLGESATVSASAFIDNSVTESEGGFFTAPVGGAIVTAGAATITDSRFTGNSAPLGGAIGTMSEGPESAATPSLTISGSTFSENTAAWAGGAIFSEYAESVTVTDSDFKDNASGEVGGAIYVDGDLEISGSLLARNLVEGYGGALMVQGEVDVTSSTFRQNDAGYNGGAIVADGGTIDSSSFVGNSSTYGVGAVDFGDDDGVSSSVTNSTFTRNKSADNYGALTIYAGNAAVELMHNTFADNRGTAPQHLTLVADDATAVTLTANAFVAGGKASCYVDASDVTSSYNFDADGTCTDDWAGTGDFGDGVDALVADAPADNGGATVTVLPLEGSPLIDAIPLAACTVDADQRGEVRPAGTGCDIGAVEVQPATGDIAFQIPTDQGVIYGVAKGAVSVDGIGWTSALTGAPAGVAFPLGLSSFTVHTATPGATVTIELTLPRPANELWKETDGTWQEVDATIDGLTVIYAVTDGGDLDEDGTANAMIVDPVAPGLAVSFTG